MKRAAFPLGVVLGLSLLALPATWAQQQPPPRPAPGGQGGGQAPALYQQCQERLKANAEAKKLCDEGMRLFREGKQEEGVQTIQEGLSKIK